MVVGGEKVCYWLVVLFGECDGGVYVDCVDVGLFFLVDFDIDEVCVYGCGYFVVVEWFVGYDVILVVGGVVDG